MTLKPGTQLGPYEIVAPIGAGGMGEVYRARDPRVGRDVAVKVASERFNERFEREARAVAALNHSDIATLYDVGPDYLVMELVEGPTLADRIEQGVLPQPAAELPRRKGQKLLPRAAALLGMILVGVVIWNLRSQEPRRVVRFEYELPAGQQFSPIDLAISPDGSQFVYGAAEGLYLRKMDQSTAKLIPGADGNSHEPEFSPDGKRLCYWSRAENQLKKIAVSGGTSVKVCSTLIPWHISWDADGTIVFGGREGIKRISSNGGTPELLVKAGDKGLGAPQILPDGRTMLFTIVDGENSRIAVHSLRSGERKELLAGDSTRYLSTGQIAYTVGNSLFAVRFDPGRLEIVGEPVSLVDGVFKVGANAFASYAISDFGTLIYVPGGTVGSAPVQTTPVWVDRKGKEEPLGTPPHRYTFPKLSPDGNKLALTVAENAISRDIWIWDLARKILSRLTFDSTDEVALWTPDGKRIAYTRMVQNRVYLKASDGTEEGELLTSVPNTRLYPWSWSGNGRVLVLADFISGSNGMLSLAGEPCCRRKSMSRASHKFRLTGDGWVMRPTNRAGKRFMSVHSPK